MARARWEQTALVCLMLHNNGFNQPITDPQIFNPYSQSQPTEEPQKVQMRLEELAPLLDRAFGPKS